MQIIKKFCNAKMSFSSIHFFWCYRIFIFGILKDFCRTMQSATFQHRSPKKIMRYSALIVFKKIVFLMTSAIDMQSVINIYNGVSKSLRQVIYVSVFGNIYTDTNGQAGLFI